ncbi:retrotransposon protein, putative, ty1-copia subclass [Tanacetum coccineum]
MASSINPELQKTFEKTWAYEMNQQLKEMFQTKACKERLDAVKSPMAYKLKLGASISAFVLTVGHNAKKRKTSHSNWKGKAAKGKFDRGSKKKVEYEIAPTSDLKEAVCFYCNTKGHWKSSCPKYLKDLKDGKLEKGSHSGPQEKLEVEA